jgi:hypothetical protein
VAGGGSRPSGREKKTGSRSRGLKERERKSIGWREKGLILVLATHLTACSVGWWLMAGAGLF